MKLVHKDNIYKIFSLFSRIFACFCGPYIPTLYHYVTSSHLLWMRQKSTWWYHIMWKSAYFTSYHQKRSVVASFILYKILFLTEIMLWNIAKSSVCSMSHIWDINRRYDLILLTSITVMGFPISGYIKQKLQPLHLHI